MKKIIQSDTQASIYADLRKLVKRANQRIVRIEREFGKDTWGIAQIKKYLDNPVLKGWTAKGRIRLTKSMGMEQLEKIQNVTEKFLTLQTSTISGIKDVQSGIKAKLSSFALKSGQTLTSKDVEYLYRILHDENVRWLGRYTEDESDVLIFISDAIEKRMDADQFIDYIQRYLSVANDQYTRSRIQAIYDKFVR